MRWINNRGMWTSTDTVYNDAGCNTWVTFSRSRDADSYSGAQVCVNRRNFWTESLVTCTWAL